MNPYNVLNVAPHATEEEIKAAYRNLVKQYHPDRNNSDSAKVIIVRVNEAYEILSDPLRKARYDGNIVLEYEQTLQEDPIEKYKREYKRRKWEEAKKQKEEVQATKIWKFKIARVVSMPILLFSLLLVADHFLPHKHYEETADWGWHKSGGSRRSQYYVDYMRTPHFILSVPNEVRLDYDYFDNPGLIKISASPIFEVPESVVVTGVSGIYQFQAGETIYSGIPFQYLLLLSSLFTVFRKKYSEVNYIMCYLPLLIFCIIIIKLIP